MAMLWSIATIAWLDFTPPNGAFRPKVRISENVRLSCADSRTRSAHARPSSLKRRPYNPVWERRRPPSISRDAVGLRSCPCEGNLFVTRSDGDARFVENMGGRTRSNSSPVTRHFGRFGEWFELVRQYVRVFLCSGFNSNVSPFSVTRRQCSGPHLLTGAGHFGRLDSRHLSFIARLSIAPQFAPNHRSSTLPIVETGVKDRTCSNAASSSFRRFRSSRK